MSNSPMPVGVVGCGAISAVYMKCCRQFENFKIVKCADVGIEYARARAAEFGIEAVGCDELFADPEIKLIINLTPPSEHAPINRRAVESGKHVYSEKPFAVSLPDALEVDAEAKRRGLFATSAPDSFLGAAQQYLRQLVDSGEYGTIFGGTAATLGAAGYHSNHRDITFFFRRGAGPLFDMGPYHLSALVSVLGPVTRVGAMGRKLAETRTCVSGSNAGLTFPIGTETNLVSSLEFASGAVVSFNASFDVRAHRAPLLELFGENGSLALPDQPCNFGSQVEVFSVAHPEWRTLTSPFGFSEVTRGLGVADLVAAIEEGREPRCAPEFALHVLEIMCAIEQSVAEGGFVKLRTTCRRPEPMPIKF